MIKRWLDYLIGVPLIAALAPFQRRRARPGSIQRILIIKLAAMGDAILLVPVLKSLRDKFPQAEIDWLISAINRPLARHVPQVNSLIEWRGGGPGSLLSLARQLRGRHYDVVIDAEQWARGTALLAFLSGAPVRVGFDTPGQRRAGLFTDTWRKSGLHELDEFYELFSRLAPLERRPGLDLWELPGGIEELRAALPDVEKDGGPLVVLHPGCGDDGGPREWPLANYAVLAHWLAKRYRARIVLTGGPEERRKTAALNRMIQGQGRDLGGRLSWSGTFSLLKRAALLVSGNTGVMHAAAAFGTKQVALHGPTDADLWGPLNRNAVVLKTSCPECPSLKLGFEYHRRDAACMARIGVDEVKAAAESLLGRV